jgi:hypothetical protein
MRVPRVGITHYDVVSRAVWRTYPYLNMIVNDQHLEVPSGHARVYSPAQDLYGPIYSPVSLLLPDQRQLSTHLGDAHLRAPPRARINPSACTLITPVTTLLHRSDLAPCIPSDTPPRKTSEPVVGRTNSCESHGMCNSDLLPKGLADLCMRRTWLIMAGRHPGCHPTVCTSLEYFDNPRMKCFAKQHVLLKGATKGTGHKTTEN